MQLFLGLGALSDFLVQVMQRVAELGGHFIKSLGKFANFILSFNVSFTGEIPLHDLPGNSDKVEDWPDNVSSHHYHDNNGGRNGHKCDEEEDVQLSLGKGQSLCVIFFSNNMEASGAQGDGVRGEEDFFSR